MDGPEDLRQAVQFDHVAGPLAGVIGGEAAVAGGVPVLRGDDEVEFVLQAVRDGNDRVAVGDGQRAAGDEVVLNVDEDEGVHFISGTGSKVLVKMSGLQG